MMDRLRSAIMSLLSESLGMAGELSVEERAVLREWNKMCEASPTVGIPAPITEEDLEEFFD